MLGGLDATRRHSHPHYQDSRSEREGDLPSDIGDVVIELDEVQVAPSPCDEAAPRRLHCRNKHHDV